jgi:hypothetical protein
MACAIATAPVRLRPMSVFVIVPLAGNLHPLTERVMRRFSAADRYPLPSGAGWLLSYRGTTIDLSNLLEVTGQAEGERSPIGSTLLVPITSYYGRAPTDMWEWIRVKMEAAQ